MTKAHDLCAYYKEYYLNQAIRHSDTLLIFFKVMLGINGKNYQIYTNFFKLNKLMGSSYWLI